MTQTAKPKRPRKPAQTPKNDAPIASNGDNPAPPSAGEQGAKPAGKADRILMLLQRPEGATLQDLVTETGWQRHTTRAALTGLRKKGHTITSEKADGIRRYRATATQ